MDSTKKTHPIDRSTWFTRVNLFWTFEEMAKSDKGSYQQESHFQLPHDDKIREAKEVFETKYKANKSIMRTIGSVFSCDIAKLIFLATIVNLLTQAGPYVLGEVVGLLSDHSADLKSENPEIAREYRIRLFSYFGFLAISLLVVGTLTNYVEFTSNRLGFRIVGSVNLLIFDKIQRINVLNKTEHSTGNILNYVQIDSTKFQANLARVINLVSCIFSLIFGIAILYIKIGDISFIILGVFLFGCVILTLLYNLLLTIIDNLMNAKDRRVLVLTNIISNVKYVKLRAWENFFQYKMSGVRGLELKYLFHLMMFNCADIFTGWLNLSLCQIAFVVAMTYLKPNDISVPTVSAALGVLGILFTAIQWLPWFVGLLMGFVVSLGRITSFLEAEELEFGLVNRDPEVLRTYGMLMVDGDFSWLPPPKDITLEENKKSNKKRTVNSIAPTLNDSLLAEEPTTDYAFRIQDLNIKIPKGSLVFVIGKIGSGKSSLLYALVGEMKRTANKDNPTKLFANDKMAMLSQTPWLIGSSVKVNIILDLEFDEQRFERALRLSQLKDDVVNMADGIDTFIGENGQTVSGGQRTRIALARLIYQDPDIFVLDDPLSALDLKVADKIMKEGICGELKDKTRIISTHAIHNLKYADYVYVMDAGKVVFEGTFSQMTGSAIYNEFIQVTEGFKMEEEKKPEPVKLAQDPELVPIEDPFQRRRKTSIKEQTEIFENVVASIGEGGRAAFQTEEIKLGPEEEEEKEALLNKLFMEEDRVQGGLGFSTILTVVKEIGGFFPIFLILMSVTCLMVTNFLSDYYHLEWAGIAKDADESTRFQYMWLLIYLLIIRCVMTSVRSLFVFGTVLLMSKNMHAKMMFRILHARIAEFLERVPAGRIINRFTKDIEVIDREIGWSFSNFYLSMGSVVVNIIVLLWTVGPLLAGPMILFLAASVYYQRKLMKTKREVVRLEAISRSPMMTCVAGLVRGAPEIRILKKQRYVTEEFIDRLEDNIKNNILMYGLDAWYMNQINICNVFLIQIPGFLIISYFLFMQEGAMSLAKIVLFVLRSQDISTSLTQMLLSFSQLETQMVSIERCSNFSKIEPEPRYLNFELHEKKYLHPTGKNVVQQILRELEAKETSIIPTGKVFFSNVTAKYLSKPKPVLNRLNMQIAPGEKIGIVGRTGAGKTSLIKLFWMCLEPSEGKVILDDKDAMKVDLKVLRSNLDVISQETAIFEGTMRENLDPKLEYLMDKNTEEFKKRDKELLQRLYDIGFTPETLDGKGLDYRISAGGDNLSLGQKQLICFMRVLINPKKLMILDEATANIDLKTEKLMQEAVKHEFKKSTMFIIAHRIQTVLECDKICIMDQGRIVEFGTPRELIRRPGSRFGEIYKKLQENVEATLED